MPATYATYSEIARRLNRIGDAYPVLRGEVAALIGQMLELQNTAIAIKTRADELEADVADAETAAAMLSDRVLDRARINDLLDTIERLEGRDSLLYRATPSLC